MELIAIALVVSMFSVVSWLGGYWAGVGATLREERDRRRYERFEVE